MKKLLLLFAPVILNACVLQPSDPIKTAVKKAGANDTPANSGLSSKTTKEEKLAYIDSVVSAIDMDAEVKNEVKKLPPGNGLKDNATYIISYDKKRENLLKTFYSEVSDTAVLNLACYYDNNSMIKIEGKIKGKEEDAIFIYFENNNPLFFSGNLIEEHAKAIQERTQLMYRQYAKL